MRRSSRGWTLCALATAFVVMNSAHVPGQQTDSTAKTPKEKLARGAERASGVIIKSEAIDRNTTSRSSAEKKNAGNREASQAIRLTINTAAVWSDWARDQATAKAADSPRKAAARGADSVATRGEPVSKDTVVVIHLNPDSKVETRFRSLQDETGKGAKTPEEASRKDAAEAQGADSDSKSGANGSRTTAAKPVRFTAADLRPGLFVEIDFRTLKTGNLASTVAVIRPVNPARSSAGNSGK